MLKHFKQGNCQAVLTDDDGKFVYKIPLSKNSDIFAKPAKLKPKEIYYFINRERRYWANNVRFKNSLEILSRLEKISQNGLDEFFPETKILQVSGYQYSVNGAIKNYSGKIIQQEFVDNFFNNQVSLQSFDWCEIPNIEVELWRYGVGIGAPADTWGPKNWGKIKNNAVKLVDTSHLTEEFKVVSKMIDWETMELRKKKLLSCGLHDPVMIDRYFEFIKSKINPNNLSKNWCKYIRE